MLTYAIGDIHGEFGKLRSALSWIWDDAGSQQHRVIFLGDYIDRGPKSRQVVESIMEGQAAGHPWIALMGNHEELMIGSIDDSEGKTPSLEVWLNNGGDRTWAQFKTGPGEGDVDTPAITKAVDWMRRLPLYFEDDYRIFCHSGVIDPRRPMAEQSREMLLWGRPRGPINHDKLIVHGHTPHWHTPQLAWGRLNLDTAACFNGKLTVARFVDAEGPWIMQPPPLMRAFDR